MTGSIGDRVKLANGVLMPWVGFGSVYVEEAEKIVHAIELGYRNVDTATDYGNEAVVGEAVRTCGLPREELFVTTKVWNSSHGYEKTLKAFDESLKTMKLDYIDLYLIHWPCPEHDLYVDTWKAMMKLYEEGRVRAIGVANFYEEWLERLEKECGMAPLVNQVECNPYTQKKKLRAYCQERHIQMEAYTPIARGMVNEDETIQKIARKYGKNCVQVTMRFLLQEGIIAIPRTNSLERMKSNVDIFDFALSQEDMEAIRRLDRCEILTGEDPRTFHELKNLKDQTDTKEAQRRSE